MFTLANNLNWIALYTTVLDDRILKDIVVTRIDVIAKQDVGDVFRPDASRFVKCEASL